MSIRALILAIFLSFSLVHAALAFQFDVFTWGSSKETIEQQIRDKRKNSTSSADSIVYVDSIFGYPCEITLYLTKEIHVLYMVKIYSSDPAAGNSFKERLIALHGEPGQEVTGVERYIWLGKSEEDVLGLDYSRQCTELIYSAGEDTAKSDNEKGDTF